jgi:hypothetical protein
VSDRELDVVAVLHRQKGTLFGIELIASDRIFRSSSAEDRRAIARLDTQRWLEQPRLVLRFLRLDLAIDEEERQDSATTCQFSDTPLDEDFWVLFARPLRLDRTGVQGDRHVTTDGAPLPHHLWIAGLGLEDLAVGPLVMTPGSLDHELLYSALDDESEP